MIRRPPLNIKCAEAQALRKAPIEPAKAEATRLDLGAIRARADAAENGPWFYNGYSAIVSKPLSDVHMRMERELDERLLAEGGREAVDDDFDKFPDTCVASVRIRGGDTATVQGSLDATFVAHAREDIPALLDEVERLRSELEKATGYIETLAAPLGTRQR